MTMAETAKILALIVAAYPGRGVKADEMTVGLWRDMFADDDAREVMLAVKAMFATCKFPPTIADVKEAMQRQRAIGRGDLSAGEAWEKVVREIRRNYCHPDKARAELGENIWAVIQQCGGWSVCGNSEITVISAQFERRYNAQKEQQAYAEKLPAGLAQGVKEILGVMMIEGGKP